MAIKHVVFLVSGAFKKPGGGAKIILEYANRLSLDGIKVTMLYSSALFFNEASWALKVRMIIRYLYNLLTGSFTCNSWFRKESTVDEKWVWSLEQSYAPVADCYIATSVETASFLDSYKVDSNKKFYFIQGFEDWVHGFDAKRVLLTYHYDLQKIVISSWLQKMVEDEGLACVKVPNGFNFKEFKCVKPSGEREPYTVAMLYNTNPAKGMEYSFEALDIVKKRFPQLKVNVFGVHPRPAEMPSWYNYYQSPDINKLNWIYNNSLVYLATSVNEGWGLTVGEAMICGCAVVCTDAKGFLEMAKGGENALVVPKRDAESAANAMIRLIDNCSLRERLVNNALLSIREFDIEDSYKLFKANIIDAVI